ncbi:MAG: hypothetical protein M3N68_02945 [Actinomycetota bacterium]|nr:hypothetical protein [Actinomycetota bacterium]
MARPSPAVPAFGCPSWHRAKRAMVAGLVWSAWGVPALLVFLILVAIGAELVTVVVTRRHGLTVTRGRRP